MANIVFNSLRRCIVPGCENDSKLYPYKKFFSIPSNKIRRQKWFDAINTKINRGYKGNNVYCCEDHFDLETDVENYIRFKLMQNVRLQLKKDVVPHIFNGQHRDPPKGTPHIPDCKTRVESKPKERKPINIIVVHLGPLPKNSGLCGNSSISISNQEEKTNTKSSSQANQIMEMNISEMEIKQEYLDIDIQEEGVQDFKETFNPDVKQEYIIPDYMVTEMKQEIKEEINDL